MILGGLGAGLGLGLLLALGLELVRQPLRSPNQIEGMGLPVLGIVPLLTNNPPGKRRFGWPFKRRKALLDPVPTISRQHSMNSLPDGHFALSLAKRADALVLDVDQATIKSYGIFGFDSIDPRSRSFNLIRARLTSLHRERGWRSFGVVSAASQVGKSFVSANISAALSRNPRYETTLVDLDLRRGSVSTQCGISADESMRDYLDGSDQVTVPPAYAFRDQRLTILPTRAGIVRSAEMLSSERAQSLYQAMRAAPDNHLFIVDLPPVFANDDATAVIQRLDSYMLVAEEGKTTRSEIAEASALLGSDRLAGVVLNKYRGGLVREGYGVDDYYNAGYGAAAEENARGA